MVVTVKFGPDINVLKAIKNFSTNTEIEPELHQAYHALCIYTRTHTYIMIIVWVDTGECHTDILSRQGSEIL